MNSLLFKHIALPALAPSAVVALYFTPVEVFGCANRGLMALAVVLGSLIAAVVTVGIGLWVKARNHSSSSWWLASTFILVLPCVLVFGPLG